MGNTAKSRSVTNGLCKCLICLGRTHYKTLRKGVGEIASAAGRGTAHTEFFYLPQHGQPRSTGPITTQLLASSSLRRSGVRIYFSISVQTSRFWSSVKLLKPIKTVATRLSIFSDLHFQKFPQTSQFVGFIDVGTSLHTAQALR